METTKKTCWQDLKLFLADNDESSAQTAMKDKSLLPPLAEFRRHWSMMGVYFSRDSRDGDHVTDSPYTWGPYSPNEVDWFGFDEEILSIYYTVSRSDDWEWDDLNTIAGRLFNADDAEVESNGDFYVNWSWSSISQKQELVDHLIENYPIDFEQ